ncbi:hypothetical protein [Vibrio parahaemolyticus]|uniref:hypothetical protein n=1 Tax=Vibrio parahaemolyticus TaxID=670 RepID=UPI0035312F05|nr:hypothetical protein [Vibrio parahaemolyticus]HCG6960569.1 hypothetical protein [Vibrio parahaemolyticus]HCM0793278.1 hypothetical protein [Vibrio parahaemolyticus]
MDIIVTILGGGVGGAVISWLARTWISERLKQSIGFEYSQKLESYKTDLNAKVETIKHDNQVTQLRTSLFFDHQREAYASLITKVAEINEDWGYLTDPDEGLWERVPYSSYKELKNLMLKHQLFLDDESMMALDLILDTYLRSFPFDMGDGKPHQSETSALLATCEYLQPRLASIFRSKIGMTKDELHLKEVATLAGITYLNTYHFLDVEVPPEGILNIRGMNNAADKVRLGLDNFAELSTRLDAFDLYLSKDGGWIHEAQTKVKRTSAILRKFT